MEIDTFTSKAEAFLDEADYLGENDLQVYALRRAAAALDEKVTIAMFKEFNALVMRLEAKRPVEEIEEEEDELLAPVVGLETRESQVH